MLRKTLYPKVENLLNRFALRLHQQGFSPNQLTLAGLGLNFLAGWIYSGGFLFLGALVVIAAAFGDLLDGPLARTTGRATKFGAFFDSTVDRYSDFFIFGGLALHFALSQRYGQLLITLGILMGAVVTSYAKARAENLIEDCSVGIFERPERVILIVLGTLVSPLLTAVLWILLIGTNATAIQRILHTRKAAAENRGAA